MELSSPADVQMLRMAEVAGVDADDRSAGRDGAAEGGGLVRLDEHAHLAIVRVCDESAQLVVGERLGDEQHGVRTRGTGLVDLDLHDDDVLAEDRRVVPDRVAHGDDVVERPTPVARLGEDGDGARARGDIPARLLAGIDVGAEHPERGRDALHLGDDGESSMDLAQRGRERVGVGPLRRPPAVGPTGAIRVGAEVVAPHLGRSATSRLLRVGPPLRHDLLEVRTAAGLVAVADPIKDSTREAIRLLHESGVRIVMLTGDSRTTAEAVAKKLGIDEVEAEVLPQQKNEVVKRLQNEGRVVAMAGDGINDAPALAQAQVGIAMGSGTDVAIESAGITLLKGDLRGIAKARRLSHGTMKNIRQNLFFAFVYNSLGIPLAAGVLYPFFGLLLSPLIASAAMTFSSVSVISNALRLRRLAL